MDSNPGPQVSEANTLPSVPNHCFNHSLFLNLMPEAFDRWTKAMPISSISRSFESLLDDSRSLLVTHGYPAARLRGAVAATR